MTRKLLFSFALLGIVFAVGCSGNLKLTGTVVFSDDDMPVPTGIVYFDSDKGRSVGPIMPDGTYTVSTTGDKDGIPRGKTFKVSVIAEETKEILDANGVTIGTQSTPLIDPKYGNPAASGLTFTSDGGMKTFPIKVDRAK